MNGMTKEHAGDRRQTVTTTKWTFNKSISYGDLLVTASLLLGGLTAYFSAEKRISQLEFRSSLSEEALKNLSNDMKTELRELKLQSTQTQLEVLRLAATRQDVIVKPK